MANYKEKIKKLLALAEERPYEHEAKAALLKVRELMDENKLTEADVKDAEEHPRKCLQI